MRRKQHGTRALWLGVFGFFTGISSCSASDGAIGPEPSGCEPGGSVPCACVDGSQGTQACLTDGTFGACSCSATGAPPVDDPNAGTAVLPPPEPSASTAEPSSPVPDPVPPPPEPTEPMPEPIEPPADDPGASAPPPAYLPVYRIPLRVHIGQSNLRGQELLDVLTEMNAVWLDQAGVCFEIHTVLDDATMSEGFDLWFSAGPVPGASGVNGIYRGSHDVWTRDYPSLGYAPNPIDHPAARTAAHELGHGLTLDHQNCGNECPCGASMGLDCDDLLMRSGRLGFALTPPEIEAARVRASVKALADTAPMACSPPVISE